MLGDVLKIVQITFYVVAGVVAVLSYRAAVRGWLTPTNTEYQKRVMDRLAELSKDLYKEFDPNSATEREDDRVRKAIAEFNAIFEANRESALARKKWDFDVAYPEVMDRLDCLLGPIQSDPFVPEEIRDAVIELAERRLRGTRRVYRKELKVYADRLAQGEKPLSPEAREDRRGILEIIERIRRGMREQKCDWGSNEKSVHTIRSMVKDYFEAFNPHGVRKGRRKKYEKPPATPPSASSPASG
jgi:hypothetical protein